MKTNQLFFFIIFLQIMNVTVMPVTSRFVEKMSGRFKKTIPSVPYVSLEHKWYLQRRCQGAERFSLKFYVTM